MHLRIGCPQRGPRWRENRIMVGNSPMPSTRNGTPDGSMIVYDVATTMFARLEQLLHCSGSTACK